MIASPKNHIGFGKTDITLILRFARKYVEIELNETTLPKILCTLSTFLKSGSERLGEKVLFKKIKEIIYDHNINVDTPDAQKQSGNLKLENAILEQFNVVVRGASNRFKKLKAGIEEITLEFARNHQLLQAGNARR